MATQKVNPAEMPVSTTDIAGILGVTARRVQQLSQDKILIPVSRGKYEIGDSVQRYIIYLQGRKKQTDDSSDDARKLKAEADLKEHKATIARLQAEEAEGKMHRAEDVKAMTEDLLLAVRGVMYALPGRLAVDVSNAANAAEVSVIIKREISFAMKDLADYRYDPAKYKERVRERMKMEAEYAEAEEDSN